jgi:hypothetical protein
MCSSCFFQIYLEQEILRKLRTQDNHTLTLDVVDYIVEGMEPSQKNEGGEEKTK